MNVLDQTHRPDWSLYNADCVEAIRAMPACSIDLSVYSPPFSSLYVFSASERDMANVTNDGTFGDHYAYLTRELYRATRPGRLCAVHCKDLNDYKNVAGRSGLRDFPGQLVRIHEDTGWKYTGRITIWKDPVNEVSRTKTQRLLWSQMLRDSSLSAVAMPDYILLFRRWPEAGEESSERHITHDPADVPVKLWQEWASPVWMTVNQTDVLNVAEAKTDKDERHLTPLQLGVIERLVRLYSNPGDVVFSPFAGIGSEGVVSLQHGRKFVGIELKPEYYRTAVTNLDAATAQLSLF